MQLAKIFPILDWLGNYKKEWLKGDISAGLTVGVMLIPQGMAYAMIADVDPVYGLYASTIPLIIYAILGTSRQLAVGPTAVTSMLTVAAVAPLAENDAGRYLMLVILMAFMVGVIQIVMGLMRLGFLVNFLSHPVISGFTSAAAIIIGVSQLNHILGVSIDRSHHIHNIIYDAYLQIEYFNWPTIIIGVLGILIILFVKKLSKMFPSQLLVVLLGIGAVYLFNLDQFGVKILGDIPSSLPTFNPPNFDWEIMRTMLPLAIAISMVTFMESFAMAKAIHAKHKDYRIDANQELIALGSTNAIASFFQSFPVTGGFSRTAVNNQAGAKTGLAAIISAILVILTLLFLTGLFYYLPKAILGSVIMVAVIGLVDTKEVKHLWHSDRTDFYLLIATFFSTLIFGIMEGILIGVILSIATIIYRTTKPHIAVLGKIPNTNIYKNITRFEDAEIRDDILIIRPDVRLYFANIAYLKAKIDEYVLHKGNHLKMVIISAVSINSVDSSAVSMLKDLNEELLAQNIQLVFTGVKGPVRDKFKKSGLRAAIGEDRFYTNVNVAVECFDKADYNRLEHISNQYNQ